MSGDIPAPERALDLRTEFLKGRYGLPEEWVWHSWTALGDAPPFEFSTYSGGVYPFAKSRGKNKGRTDYRRPVSGTERAVILSEREFASWLPSWEARSGKCHLCLGTGQEWNGWTAAEGTRYRDCPRCDATGKAPDAEDRRTIELLNEKERVS